jgi:AcrR family transcriptional regulator
VRNRTRILEAAEELFGTEGLCVPIDDIAKRAEVGVGTIYRHFPTKEALFEAIVYRHFERLLDTARSAPEGGDPADALFRFLAELVETAIDKRDLADALAGAGIDVKESAGELKQELEAAVEDLLARAQGEGAVRADVSITDLMALVTGTCMHGEHVGPGAASPARMLAIVCDGLRQR